MGGQCGVCQPFNRCQGATCLESDYALPTVPIAPLNGAAMSIKDAMNAQTPNGTTPTTPALKGALSYASSWAAQNPTHVVAVLLATDGFPSPECAPNDISTVAAAAQQGASASPAIRTYVIGVFTPQEQSMAQQNLDTIAQAGGGKAFLVTTGQDVTQQFLQALDEIRTSAVSCEYKLPAPQSGSLDLDKVNVKLTQSGTSTTLLNAPSAAGCPANGGWYYDAPPPASTKIVLCPQTCSAIKGDATAKVEVVLGCATQKP